jgi:hypothetical protein
MVLSGVIKLVIFADLFLGVFKVNSFRVSHVFLGFLAYRRNLES